MHSKFFRKLFLYSLIILVFAGFTWQFYLSQTYSNYLEQSVDQTSESRINFSIKKNESLKQVGQRLQQEGIVISDWAFYKYIKNNNLGQDIQAGKFILKRSYTIPEIVQFLTHARTEEVTLTIKEGLTIQQVDQFLAEQGHLLPGEFENCAKECALDNYYFLDARPDGITSLEGYLFADTYFVDPDTLTARGLITRMLDNFQNKLDNSGLRSKIAERGLSIHKAVIMASLIEKETRKKGEKAIVSGILWKRYSEGIHLGVDATVRYALNSWTAPLTYEDLATDSPYNTRTKLGLPPTPISNFSLSSLEAAVISEESDYYYYLHDNEGFIHYATTNEEHNANKRKYL
jgi:UPF0755 protein